VRARPFPKFFNYGTPEVGELPAEPFTVTEKVDGSLGIFYVLQGQGCIATRGSFISEQAIEGTRMLADHVLDPSENTTPLFEIVYPENRIVVDYGDRRELVLLGAVDDATGKDAPLPAYSGPVVTRHLLDADLDELAGLDRPNCEGYVVSFESGLRVKIKHAEYVRLHRIITGVNARHIWEALCAGQDPVAELDGVPDELFGWVDTAQAGLRDEFKAQAEAALALFKGRPPTEDRREIAEYFKRSGGNTGVLFRMLDDKPYDDLIWKSIKPEPTTPDTIWTRDVEAVA
jgi:RNA ligase